MQNFNQLKKNLKKEFRGLKKIKLALLADSASQLLHQAIKGYGYEMQIDFEIYEADYNQIERQITDSSSELYNFKPDFIFINQSTEHLIKLFYKSNKNEQIYFSEDHANSVRSYYTFLSNKLNSKIIINTFPEINDSIFGNYASKVENSFLYQLRKTNIGLMDLSRECKNLFILDLTSLASTNGYDKIFDPKMYVNGDTVYNLDFLPEIAKHLSDIIQACSGTFKKCLILDLDNTTWGGIIGDDGIEGIQIGELGIGKAFTELQLWAKQLNQRGIILAICSKNTESIAKEPFISHPEMVLKLDDIAVFVANWENKVDNIRYIQSVLNIGFDSIVFLDDNPFEREMVKQGIPNLCVPDLPEDPAEYLLFLRKLNLFETASYTEEDKLRTKQYQEEAKRNILQKSFATEDEFLKSLEMCSEVKKINSFTIPRVAQLSQRSNQFNLRTVRYSEEEIKHISASEDYYSFTFTLQDKFGDHGLISAIILKKESETNLFIDTWIMSCRVLKRGMEYFTLNNIVTLANENGFEKLTGEYIPTHKNGIVENHYLNLGFKNISRKWVLDVESYIAKKNYIKIKKNELRTNTF